MGAGPPGWPSAGSKAARQCSYNFRQYRSALVPDDSDACAGQQLRPVPIARANITRAATAFTVTSSSGELSGKRQTAASTTYGKGAAQMSITKDIREAVTGQAGQARHHDRELERAIRHAL